ncbi:unnamed protein product [Rotaria sp. Silwood1]|nr:unnamed protein product [Rotaria sp. Silwood1]
MAPFSFTYYQYLYVATSTNTTMMLAFRQDPNYWCLDDISVEYNGMQMWQNGGFETSPLTQYYTYCNPSGASASGTISASCSHSAPSDLRVLARSDDNDAHSTCTSLVQPMPAILYRHDLFSVTFGSIDDETIRVYIETGEPMNKAGTYSIQSLGAVLVKKIDDDYFNVVGFSIDYFCIQSKALLNNEIKFKKMIIC